VVVQGLGAVGMMMLAKARLLGAGKVIGLDCLESKLQLAQILRRGHDDQHCRVDQR